MLTKGAIGNLINRYRAVLSKCRILNTFGSLAVASMLVLGGAGVAEATLTKNNHTPIATEATLSGTDFKDNDVSEKSDANAKGGQFIIEVGGKLSSDGPRVTFSGNKAQCGGAIYNNGRLEASGTLIFENNIATEFGGAIDNNGTLCLGADENGAFTDSKTSSITFTNNKANPDKNNTGCGGAIKNSGKVYIANATFDGNIASTLGGAIDNLSSTSSIFFYGTNTFTGNSAKESSSLTGGTGGAISNAGTLYLGADENGAFTGRKEANFSFSNNSAESLGGAIYINNKAYIANAKFENNTAYGGGAIGNSAESLQFFGANTFNANEATGDGGAIHNVGYIDFKSTSTNIFSNNEAPYGGAIYNNLNGSVFFSGTSIFSGNTASKAGNDIYNNVDCKIFVKSGAILSLDGGYAGGGTITFENGSVFEVADASKIIEGQTSTLLLDGKDYLSSTINDPDRGALVIEDGAKLKLNNVASGNTYRIADNFAGIYSKCDINDSPDTSTKFSAGDTPEGWNGKDNLISDTHLLVQAETKIDEDGNGVIVVVTSANENSSGGEGTSESSGAAAILPGVIPVNALNEIARSGISADSEFMGRRFLSRAQDTDYLPGGTAPASSASSNSMTRAALSPAAPASEAGMRATSTKLINEVARAAVTVGVQNTALRISDAAADLNLDHLSLANHNKASSFHSDGSDFWAAPLYGNLYSSGMTLNSDSVRGQFGGLALGADTEIGQIAGGKMRLGAALHGGGGQSETKGTLTTAQNDYDFGGLSFYAGWNKGAFNLIGSLGYGFGNHEVEMALPSSIDMGVAKADIDTSAFTADLRAEYELKAGWLNVVPHIGLRYTMLKTDAHELSVPGGVMTEFAADTQNIMQFPIGVALSADTTFGGWTVKPGADVSFIPACGETDAYTRMHFTGVDAWDSVNSRIMDSTSYAAELSLKAEKGNFSLGLSYGVQASSHETDQNIQFKLGWKF